MGHSALVILLFFDYIHCQAATTEFTSVDTTSSITQTSVTSAPVYQSATTSTSTVSPTTSTSAELTTNSCRSPTCTASVGLPITSNSQVTYFCQAGSCGQHNVSVELQQYVAESVNILSAQASAEYFVLASSSSSNVSWSGYLYQFNDVDTVRCWQQYGPSTFCPSVPYTTTTPRANTASTQTFTEVRSRSELPKSATPESVAKNPYDTAASNADYSTLTLESDRPPEHQYTALATV